MRQFFVLTILLYLHFLYNLSRICFSAPVFDNVTLSYINDTSSLLNETIESLSKSEHYIFDPEIMDNDLEVLPEDMETEKAGESNELIVSEGIPEALFISKEESNSFLAHSRQRRAPKRKRIKNTGALEYAETSKYKNFRYGFPKRETWWPKWKGANVEKKCLFHKGKGFCNFKEVYVFYKDGWKKSPPWTYELTSVVYRYCYCSRGPDPRIQRECCPKPCANKPCSKPHMTKCVETGSKVTKSYRCECQKGWNYNPSKQICEDIKVCGTSLSKCVTRNTQRCVDGRGLDHTCECKPQWMGEQCEQPFDACLHYNNPCGVHGLCIAHRGQQTWSCDCDKGWGDDPNHRGRDCNKKDNPCEDLICRNGGECQKSASRAFCLCPDTYEGIMCEKRKPQWNPWMSWSDCSVTCGTGGKWTRRRICDHAGAAYCGGGQANEEASCSGPLCLVDGQWGAWMKMTDCSHNCGGGRYLRSRNCEYTSDDPDTYGKACEGELLSYEECNIMSCPKKVKRKTMVDIESLARSILAETGIAEGDWGAWNSWTSCSESCGQGFQQRGRMCLNSLGTCEGDSEEFQDCYETDCEGENEFLPWSTWSVWSMCGPMTPKCTRTRHCPYGANDPVYAKACPGDSVDEAPCRFSTCTGEAPASLVDVANVMGGDAAMQMQMGNGHATGLHPGSYLNAAAPGFVAAAPVAMAHVAMGPVVPAGAAGYPQNPAMPNMNRHGGHKSGYETETVSAAGGFGGLIFVALLICCCCFVKKKFGNKDSQTSGSGYQTKNRLKDDDYY